MVLIQHQQQQQEEEIVRRERGKKGMRVGKYELGRTLGEGNFGKVKFAKHTDSAKSFAIKILEKNRIQDLRITDQIKREIRTLKVLKHPNVVRLYEVLASKTKIYMVLEYVNGGELFDRIATKGKLSETLGRKLFQQLIDGVSYCHDKGVFHRDLKLENVLIDGGRNIKITDFGLSALPQHLRDDGLLHTTCGSPNYVAPEVLSNRGYNGATSDTWSCGVILYVILTGFLPFDDRNLAVLYQKPLDIERNPESPSVINNAFQLIGMSSCLDLSGFFENEDVSERKIRFTSNLSPKELLDRIENLAVQMGFQVQKKPGKLKVLLENKGQKTQASLSIVVEVFEISTSLYVVELQKSSGDSAVYRQLCNKLSDELGVQQSEELLTNLIVKDGNHTS
ncbi:CBL-interacting serine/threonine-protein kinase 1 isoform X2 [Solanum lycopersicum]|uniref:CBL-interacting serine/threonine-protein kinase 1 isoform X2 n=1 Tax=Solanum lycopersicum TaxID=4081 RepID=UPI0008FEC3AD|nr:CBL-interacting serine/threonine-protein kinase 1 isoform X2 [Solanum lycopersicum]